VEVAIKRNRLARVGSILNPDWQLTKHASTPCYRSGYFAPEVEDVLVNKVRELAEQAGRVIR
jgi:hypothetical protein